MRKHNITLVLLFITFISFGQIAITTTPNPTAIAMIQSLEGPGVKFSNIDVDSCQGLAVGLFDATLSNVGLDSGVIMATGNVTEAIGPNNDGGLGAGVNGIPDDPDLNVIANVNTMDGCIIEFDMQIVGDTLRFNYVFASEEYLEFVGDPTIPGDGINDVFGFFISGPGITGTYLNNAMNIALLPDGVTPVTINNINNTQNPSFYVDNGDGTSAPQNTDPTVVQYDGLTVPLTAKIAVTPCETYHLKLAVADASDDILSSAVFLENGSFASSGLEFSTAFTDVFEGCTEGGIDFNRKDTTKQDSLTIYFDFGGTATNGDDYGISNGSLMHYNNTLKTD